MEICIVVCIKKMMKMMIMRKEKGMITVYHFYRNDWMNMATLELE